MAFDDYFTNLSNTRKLLEKKMQISKNQHSLKFLYHAVKLIFSNSLKNANDGEKKLQSEKVKVRKKNENFKISKVINSLIYVLFVKY